MKGKEFLFLDRSTGAAAAHNLAADADIHYGFLVTSSEAINIYPEKVEKGEYPPLSTTEEERAELAKKPFVHAGVTFASYEEARKVAELFEERHGSEKYDGKNSQKLTQDLTEILNEVRGAMV